MAPLLPQHQRRRNEDDEEEAEMQSRPYNDHFDPASDSEDEESFGMKPTPPKSASFAASSHHRNDSDHQRQQRRQRRRGLRMLSKPWVIFALGFLTALVPSAIVMRHPLLFFPDQCQAPSSPSPPSPQPAGVATEAQASQLPGGSSSSSSSGSSDAGAVAHTINTTFSAFPHRDMNMTASEAWDKLYSPPNQGMLYLEDPASDNPESHQVLGVSMFHALHCLGMIRNLVTNSTANADSEPAHGAHGQPGVDDGVGDDSHISHCFFYIAQTLTCGADGTLEPPSPVLDQSGFFVIDHAVDGNGHTHVCRDASLLWDVALKSQEQPVKSWGWHEGDSVQSVFAGPGARSARHIESLQPSSAVSI